MKYVATDGVSIDAVFYKHCISAGMTVDARIHLRLENNLAAGEGVEPSLKDEGEKMKDE